MENPPWLQNWNRRELADNVIKRSETSVDLYGVVVT
jgi:hypothetical protein